MQKHQDIMEKQHTQQQLDDVLLDEHTLKPVPSQFARPVGHKTNHKFAASLSTQDIKEIFTQHLNTFSNKTTTRKSAIKEISESLSAQHRIAGILTELLSVKQTQNGKQKHYAHGITVDNTVDDIGAIAYLLSSTDLFSRFTSKSIKCNHPIDVYTQSVPSFIRIVEKPLQALSVRIAGLLTAYPSHSVLLQLSELCSHLSALSIRSPIMKVLTGLELLLSKAKSDWEDTCAARHTSIQTQLNPIFKLIGFWRKLELQSWSAIFERKEEEICDAAIHNWFYLYSLIHTEEITDEFIQSIVENRAKKEKKTLHHEESFIKNASSLNPEQIFGVKAEEILQRIEESRKNPKERFGREEKHEIFLEEMFNHLNEFLESSPIGEIDIRLTMIRSFYLQMNCELHTHYDERRINDRALRVKLLRMIGNLIDYHVQFESVIIEYKKEKFEPMKAKLKELVKFSKWDLRNYWQLRESAQKSHRKLAKLCYDWKIALKRSVSGILAETDTKQTNEMAKKDPKIEFGTAEMYMKIVQKNTFLKRILSKKRIKPSINEMDVTKQCPWLVQKPSTTSVGNSTKLIQKMHKLQTKFYSDSHWKDRAQMQNDIESLCSSIIITTKEYAKKDIPSPRKQRVLSVLLSHLKQNGLRLFAPGDIDYLLPSQLFLNQSFTSKDALFAIRHHAFNEGNAGNDKYNEWFETLTQKSQDYYQNIIRKMCQLRARRMSVHPDVHQEANKCYGVTEQLLSCITFQRSHLDELLKQITTLQQWHINIQYEVNTNTTTTVSSLNIEHFFWSIRDKFTIITQCVETLTAVYTKVIAICKDKDKKQNTSDKSLANQIFDSDELAQFEECIPDFIADDDYADDAIIQSLIHSKTYVTKQYDESLQQMKSIASKLKTYQRLFDEITTHKLSPQQYESMYHEYYAPFWSSHSFTKLSSVHDGLRTIYASLQSLPCFSNLNISIPFETRHESLDNVSSNKDYVQCYESVIEEIQLCIQDVLHVIHAEEFNSSNTETKYFEFQHQSFTAITKAFHGKEIAQKLLELMHVIPHEKLANDSLNNLLLMMRSVIDIGRFALNHNICCHKSFCKLEYVLTSLFNGLFVKGFCKTEDEEKEEDGEEMMDNELGDGVGMADGEGIEDVSHEMENEGQVEGLENDKPKPQQQQKKDKPDEDEDIGVEMEQDFDGELEDVEEEANQKNKGDESDDEDLDDIDREMGDIDFNKSQVIDERMWGSEDDEAEEEDDHEEDGENDRNENQQINAKDEHSQVQAKQKTDESNKKADPNEEEEENNEQKKDEEAVAQLEFGDPLEDLDENVSDEEAMTEKKDMKTEDGEMDEAECPQRKQFDLDNDVDIEFSDSDKEEEEDETEKGEQDQLDLDALEKELAEKDKEREEEKLEDLQRGAGEIMPENEAKDDALEFLNDDEDEEADGEDGDEEETQAEAMDIDKEKNENEDGNTLQPEEADEEDEDANAPNNSDILKPNIADVDEEGNAEKDEDKGSDVEMEANEDEEAQDKDEAKQNEEEEMEDANLETDQNDADQNNDEAMGVYGGMGDTAPVGDDEEDEKEEDLEMKEDQTQMEQQMSDVFGDDQQMMQQDKTKGEWQPMNQSQKREEKKRKDKEKKEMDEKSNPFRSLGDALSEWKQRLEIIQQDENAQKEANRAEEEDADADDEDEAMDADNYAHVPDDMNVENETQALMDNQDEDMTHLPNIADINNEEDAFDDDDANDSDVFDETQGDQEMNDDEDKFDPYKKHKQAQTEDDEEMDKNKQKEVELRDLRIPKHENDDEEERKQSYLDYIEDLLNNEDTEEDDTPCRGDTTKKKEEEEKDEQKETDEEDEEDGPTAVEIAELRATLDKRLSAWHGSSLQSGDEIWRKLCLVTQSLSQQLCEELRTILEPLQMTKLGGDFRSGKRINMKKVIPYIASQFRKDKIWLRRCKPHKRNYQILVCIDDSESMRENSAGRLALESMCILTRALNKLEVGSIGVLSFGETINLLHSLQRPFSDGCGSFVCSQFSFAQRETKYQDLIATIINVLSNNDATWTNIQEHMKQNTSIAPTSTAPPSVSWDGSETLSLIFIISDARIQQDRKQLQQLVRIAHERKQIVLMIIVDSNDENTSIVNVKSIHVDPLTNKVNISSYLDEFPFPYYVLLKDIQTLPNVIADSLRQWFELIRQSS